MCAGSQLAVQVITADILAQVGYCEPLLFCHDWTLAAVNSEWDYNAFGLSEALRGAR